MDKLWTSIILLSMTQIQYVLATGCNITSVSSPSASTLKVVWSSYSGASNYLLDFRVVNSTSIAPVVVTVSVPYTQRLVQGLRPGRVYQVKLMVFKYYTLLCSDIQMTMTVPAMSQITFSQAISSTSIRFEWSSVTGADRYFLIVEEFFSSSAQRYNQSFTTLGGQVDGLTPSTTYNCYVYSSNSAGMGARSGTRTITTLVQPPTGVTLVSTGKSTAWLTWDSVSKVLLYQVAVSDNDDPSVATVIRNTASTTMNVTNLEPCSTYTVGVSSVNGFGVAGEASNVTHTTSVIYPVTEISANYSCSSGMVTVNWNLVFGANSYRATAVDGTGTPLSCTSASTSCQITMLKCGETYQVRVTAISDDCESTSNTSRSFETVPCAPANLATFHECASNVIIFTWQPTNNTNHYVATALDNTGQSVECMTADNMCFFINTGCGQSYTYTVYAVSAECNSEVSAPEFVRTSPCPPTNVKTSADCQSEVLITSWDTAAGALSYFVEAQGNTGEIYNCSSFTNSCAVPGVPCGEHLSVWIIATNDNCTSNRVLGDVAETVPCAPTNVLASVDCSQDSARVNWTQSKGAVSYIAMAEHADGTVRSCSGMGITCLIEGLSCGQTYTVSVIGTNLKCNSTASEQVTIMTAPCPPMNVEAFRDCEANHAVIVWQNHQSTGSYVATIDDQNGSQLNCTSSTMNNCKIGHLLCGKTYNVTVTYNDGICPSTAAPISMDSVPCGLQGVRTSVACSSGKLTIAWDISVPAESYTTIISTGSGQHLHCNSTDTPCTLGGLTCGSSYMVTVFSVHDNGTCFSQPSADVTGHTVPCAPTNVTVTRTCGLSSVAVTWVASLGAINYTAVAVGMGGHRSECATNETYCTLHGLQCGEVYTIGAAAVDDNCTSQLSQTVSLHTVPCPPSNLSSQLDCTAGTAQLSWSPSPNAVTYAAKAIGAVGEILSCNSSSPGCLLSDLVCGQGYNISVSASDGICASPYSAPLRQDPVPCAPLNVTTKLFCDTNILMVSWNPAAVPRNYTAIAMPLTGEATYLLTCQTEDTNCSMSGQCGQIYNVSVRASYGSCSGPYSAPQTVQAAPCAPQGLAGTMACGTHSLLASWNASLGATSYTTTVIGPNGFSESCSSPNLTCSATGLQCASQYTITVTSQDSNCSSSPSQTFLMTGPCDPVNVTSVLLCGSDMANVSWHAAAGAVAYTVLAQEDGSQHSTSCRSSATHCQLSQLNCGTVYNLTVLAEGATCNSTGDTSTVLMTAPCPPSIQNSTLICGTNSTSLSWTPVADATGYIANATAANGHTVSCSSVTTTTCELTGLLCSEIYTAVVIARGSQCDSGPSSSINITTTPCSPTITYKHYACGNNTAVFGWTDPAGSVAFLARLEGGGHLDSCLTTNTMCVFHSLPCGLDYNVTVQAQGAQCNSTPSASESIKTVPCAPQNVSASLMCFNRSALVTWVGSPSAIAYNVTAVCQDGHTHHCHTNTTSCQLPNLHCGKTYNITVLPYSESCAGNPSAVYSFSAGLCPPGNVTVSPACEGSTVSWSNVTGADMYIATATGSGGHAHNCSSNNSSSCSFADLQCGETYAVTVVTVDRGCQSEPSSAVELRTALCPPTNLVGQVSCATNNLTLTWDHVAGAAYILQSKKIGTLIPPSMYNVFNTEHMFTGLPCGQKYAFRIAARNGTCESGYSPPIELSTAPCQPTNFTARVDCGTNKGNFSWNESDGADFYTVEATGDHGHAASCSSNDSSCAVKLHCGRSYSATLVASTYSCNSSQHADIHFDSAPCLPENVVAVLECKTNVLTVSWQETPGSDNYTALAICSDGYRPSCYSTSNSCSIHGLKCGQTYEVAVTSSSIHCDIIAGSDYKVQSAPCKPENTTVDLNCSTNVITVQWDHTGTAQNYTVSATASSGVNSTCSTNETSCSFLDLSCGEHYNFTVMGHTNVCRSEMSGPIEKLTAPCPPTNVSANLNCSTGEALVTWSSAAGATAYSVQADSNYGHSSSCSAVGTWCSLNDLVCGQQYTIVVVTMHTGCPGLASVPVMLTTEPCVPMNVSVHYNMSIAQVMWDAARGASSYSVEAVADQGLRATCNTTDTNCSLTGMQCSQIYNITVTAHNLACNNTVTSEIYRLMTEPCPPTNVQASITCELLTATVSWEQSNFAVGYVAYFHSYSGYYTSCVGTDTDSHCSVSGLMCGTVYYIWVKALGQQYNSSDSIVIHLISGPCQPSGIEAIMDCQANSATISWQPSTGAMSYVTELTASSGHTASCATNHTNHTNCQLSSLQCGEEYNVTVKALGETCNNTAQMAGYLTTEPCVPMNVSVHYNMSIAQVMWDAARGASSYSVEAVADQGLTATCNTTDTNCSLTGMQCSQIYNITVTAHNLACNNTVTSESYRLMTEPCPPTNVQASIMCELLTATVSWEQSNFAVGYVAYFHSYSGYYTSCVGTDTDSHCSVSGLMCGTVYYIWVKALGQQYNSSDSIVIHLISAPCLPSTLHVDVDCSSDGAAVVSWNITDGTADFSLTVSGSHQTLCTTQQNSCNVTGLSCGESYNLSLSASNEQCNLTAPVNANLTTRPCAPQHLAVDLQCGNQTAILSWEERSEVELYITSATRESGGEVQQCNSTGSTCQFSGLACGETYNFTVTAHSHGCSSQASSTVNKTEPCQPVIVSVQALCQSEVVQISWHQAHGAVKYLVTATGSLGYEETYQTNETLLSAALSCGQDYNVTVQGLGSPCDSIPSSPAFFKTTPCIPRDVVTYVQCELNIGSVRWAPSDGAETYIAVATDRDNHTHQCVTNTTSCTWEDLHCGEEYTVKVRAKDDNCTSLPSNSSVIHMDPCVPQNLVGSVDCDMKVVSLSWNASEGAHLYDVAAVAGNSAIGLTTNDTKANFSEFTCGQVYSLTVTPYGQYCAGNSSAPAYIETWPCPPTAVSASQDCLSSIVLVTWQDSNGTDYYTATMQSDDGLSDMCMSPSSQCSVPSLACGRNFSVSVTASNQQCNSTSGVSTHLQTVPCVPTNVSVVMDCANDTAVVSWSASRGAVRYSVSAYSSQGNVTCQSSELNCSLTNLTCGSRYTVQVVAMNDNCSSTPSQALTFNSAPCPPQNVSAHVNCLSEVMKISWDPSADAEYFLVSVMAESGGSDSCNTTNTSCSTSSLTCGKTFTVRVTAVGGGCHSKPSQTLTVLSAPCQPQGITGYIDCVTNSAWISWNATSGAESYTVTALGGEDYSANCTTHTNTTCEVQDLACGVLYNFSVTAINSQCDSLPSATIDLETAPCSLSSITAFAQCHNSSILVGWDLMEGGEGNTVYIATAEASDHTYLSCNSTGTSCYLQGAQCDLHYTIIIAASSDQCSGLRSPPYKISMEPCPPRDVVVNASCEYHSALVSWSPSPVAETYHVVATGEDGHVHQCNTSSSKCSLSELHCDEQYTVYVIARHENCSSKASQNVTFNTGPCRPAGLSVTFHCVNQSAVLSWTPSSNAVDYFGFAKAEDGNMLYCSSTAPTCTIEGLECGTNYNFTVQASDGTCNSSFSDTVPTGAAPCPPDNLQVQLFPMQMQIQVMHFSWTEINCTDTQYLLTLTGSLLGDSEALFELSSYWTSMTFYEIPLPCSSSYYATVESRNPAGTSDPSMAINGTTAPCPPSGVTYSGNSSYANVSWNASVFATTYTVYNNGVSPRAQVCSTAELSCSFSNVTSTDLVITASNAAGESEATSVMNVVPQVRRRRDLRE